MNVFKSRTTCNDRAHFRPGTPLPLLAQRAWDEGICLIGRGGDQVAGLAGRNAREFDANIDDLDTYCPRADQARGQASAAQAFAGRAGASTGGQPDGTARSHLSVDGNDRAGPRAGILRQKRLREPPRRSLPAFRQTPLDWQSCDLMRVN